jgi:hypothetical protein
MSLQIDVFLGQFFFRAWPKVGNFKIISVGFPVNKTHTKKMDFESS